MGACTVTVETNGYSEMGNREVRIGTIACSTSYAAGGDTITPAQFGLVKISALLVNGAVNGTPTGYYPVPDLTNLKLIMLSTGTASGDAFNEVGAATDLHTFVANYVAFGY